MNVFWQFAARMLRFHRLLIIATIAALLDTACAFGGFATLTWVVDQLLGEQRNVRDLLLEKLNDPKVQSWVGDVTYLAQYVPTGKYEGFAFTLGIILSLAIVGSCMRFIYQMNSITVSFRTIQEIRKDAFQRMVHAPLESIMTSGTADNLSRIVRDCTQLGRGFNALLGKAVRDVMMGCAMLVLALVIDWFLTAIFLIALPIIYVCIRKFGKQIRRASKRALQAYGGMVGALQESMQASQVVKVHNAEGYERRRFNTINRQVFQQEMKARTARALSSPVIELLSIIGVVLVALVAGWYVFETPQGDPKDLVKVVLMLGVAGASFRPLANLNNDLQESAAAARRIHDILHLPVEDNVRGNHKLPQTRLPRHHESIQFKQISYQYPNSDQYALRDVSLTVKHGQTIAVVGTNGAGKSTLLSMLPRLIAPTVGQVLVDDIDIATVQLRSLRRQIAVVTQQTMLFEGTIAENIAYGRRHTSRQAIEQAARAALAHDFIATLPNGYDTRLGEGGGGLSGGQKQRVAIARAILRDPAILILDEATSQVDAESEAKINEALAAFRAGRTTFVIAHRLSTVIDADMIVMMADGQIVDRGTHQQLLERCPTYQMLTRTQLQPAVS